MPCMVWYGVVWYGGARAIFLLVNTLYIRGIKFTKRKDLKLWQDFQSITL